jgi:predicted nucleotidyltransferase
MPTNVEELLAKLKKGLTELYGQRLKAVYSLSGPIPRRLRRKKGFGACPEVDTFHLFGSYARGDFNQNSDLDVMIVLDAYVSYWDELIRSAELASELSLEYNVTISRTIMTDEQWKQGDLPVLRNVRAEGIPA